MVEWSLGLCCGRCGLVGYFRLGGRSMLGRYASGSVAFWPTVTRIVLDWEYTLPFRQVNIVNHHISY